jgi:hypothetical protein
MTTMSIGMMIACVVFGLLLIAFLVIGIAAGIKYLRSPTPTITSGSPGQIAGGR